MDVKIRPLRLGDHETSWKWRNDKHVWKYTGSRPTKSITIGIEKKWLASALKKSDQKRFAISIGKAGEYIGNAQLTNITKKTAQYHIFIGNRKYWGKGIATKVTQQVIDYAFDDLGLNSIYLFVDPKNSPAINVYKKCGFIESKKEHNKGIKMIRKKPILTVFCLTYNHDKYIAQALESFVMQKTDFDFEILIHDDASTDNTVKIIREFQKKYPNKIKAIIETENQFSKKDADCSIKKALKSIKTKYIAVCEGDDYWTGERKLQLQVDFLEKNKTHNICFHPVRLFYEQGDGKERIYPDYPDLKEFSIAELLKRNYIATSSVMYRRISYEKMSRKNFMPNDWYLSLFHARSGKIGFINKIMSVYRRHNDGIWWNIHKNPQEHFNKFGKYQLQMLLELLKLFIDKDHKEIVLKNANELIMQINDGAKNISHELKELDKFKKPIIPVCLSTDDNYAQPCMVAIASILYNSKDNDFYDFYVLDGGISENNKKKIENLKIIKDCRINFLGIRREDFNNCPVPDNAPFNIVSYFRIKIPTLIPNLDKIIYLDSDVIVKKSLKALYDIDVTDYCLAACKTQTSEANKKRLEMPKKSTYFCAGVMLINLKKWRQDQVEKKLFEHIESSPLNKLLNVDQDAINSVLWKQIKPLDQRWNAEFRTDISPSEDYKKILQDPFIMHYLAIDKPWNPNTKHDTKEYNKYLKILTTLNPDLTSFIIKSTKFNTTAQQASQINYLNFEPFSLNIALSYTKPGSVFLDVGAHHGYYSSVIGKNVRDSKIIAVEPIKNNFSMLKKNISINKINNAKLYNLAASNKEEVKKINIAETTSRSSFYEVSNSKKKEIASIKTIALDKIIGDTKLGFIKMDVEGHEIPALEGLANTIRKNPQVKLLIEHNPLSQKSAGFEPVQLLEQLKDMGFDLFLIHEYEHQISEDMSFMTVPHLTRITNDIYRWEKYMNKEYNDNVFAINKNKSINVVFFNHTAGLGGSERSLLELMKELQELGVICHVVLPYEGPLATELTNNAIDYIVIDYSWWCSSKKLSSEEIADSMSRSMTNLMNQKKLLDLWDPDIVFTNTLTIPWGAMYSQLIEKPHMTFIREFGTLDFNFSFFYGYRESLDFIKSNSDFIFTNSKSTLDHFSKLIGKDKLDYSYAFINENRQLINEETSLSFNEKKSLKLILSGNIIPNKGQEEAVRAVTRLIKQGLDIELIMLGSLARVDFVARIRNIIDENNVSDRIKLLDFIDNPFPIIKQSDVVLVCSKNEAYGRVTIEAMIMKKALIGTSTGETQRLISESGGGLLYESGKYLELAEKIKYLYNNWKRVRELGAKGYRYYKRTFSRKIYGGKIFKVMKKIKGTKKPEKNNLVRKFMNYYGKNIEKDLEALKSEINDLKAKKQQLEKDLIEKNSDLSKKDREILELNKTLSKIYASKLWNLLHTYKKLTGFFKGRLD
ncbi:MAG: FkbM family methyltransferase [Patescibacteria group bacterium]